jgi:beta-xylosidase
LFSSSDLINWKKHEHIIDTSSIKWAHKAMWAPAIIEKDGKYFSFLQRTTFKVIMRLEALALRFPIVRKVRIKIY